MQPVHDSQRERQSGRQSDTSQRWVRVFLGISLVAVFGSGVVGYRLVTAPSASAAQSASAIPSEPAPAEPAVLVSIPQPATSLIAPEPSTSVGPPITEPTPEIPEIPAIPEIPPTTLDDGVTIIAPPSIPAGNAMENGKCLTNARPMPNPTRYQRVDISYKTSALIKSTATLIRDNDLRAYEYTSVEYGTTTKWRVFEEPLRSFRVVIRPPLPPRAAITEEPQEPIWGDQTSGNQTSLPTDQYRFDSYALVGTLTNQTTARAACVYATTGVHPFNDETTNVNTISYVDANGWLIEQVATTTYTTNKWVHQTRLVFTEPPAFVITEPKAGTSFTS